jgi:hypothetical protein
MKLQIEVNVDYLDEDYNVDEAIFDAIIDKFFSEKVNKRMTELVNQKFEQTITTAVNENIEKEINSRVQAFFDRQIHKRNEFGDIIATYSSVDELIKRKFDDMFTQKVSKSNGTVNSSLHSSDTCLKIEYLIYNEIARQQTSIVSTFSKNVLTEVKNQVNSDVQKQLVQHFTTLFKLDNVKSLLDA